MVEEQILRQAMIALPTLCLYILGRKAGLFPEFPNMAIDLIVQALQLLALAVMLHTYAEAWRLSFISGALF